MFKMASSCSNRFIQLSAESITCSSCYHSLRNQIKLLRYSFFDLYSLFVLGIQTLWEQLSSEKQIKLKIKLNFEFMKQNEREREPAHLNEQKRLPKRLEQEKELNCPPFLLPPPVLATVKYFQKFLFN